MCCRYTPRYAFDPFSNFKMSLGLGSSAKLVIPVVKIRKVIIRMGIDLKLTDLW